MSSAYVICAGTSDVNAVYTSDAIWTQNNANYTLFYDDDNYWKIKYVPTNTILYQFYQSPQTNPYTESWTVVNGNSPAPKSYEYIWNNPAFDTIIVSGAGTSAIDGTYTWTTNVTVGYSTGEGQVINGYVYNGYILYRDLSDNYWKLMTIPGFNTVYDSTLSVITPPFCELDGMNGIFGGTGDSPEPAISANTASLCGTVGNNYIHSRIVETLIVSSAGSSQFNGTYYVISENGGESGSKIYKRQDINYFILYSSDENGWMITDNALPPWGNYDPVQGNLNRYYDDDFVGTPLGGPNSVWYAYYGNSPPPTVSASSERRFFINRSNNTNNIRHTS